MKGNITSLLLSWALIISVTIIAGLTVTQDTMQPAPTMTEASGGIIGSGVDELRCPKNLSGIGPTWHEITIGASSLADLSEEFGQTETVATPYPPYAGDFAPNYKFGSNDVGFVYACVAENKVAALLLDRHSVSSSHLPMVLEHWISYL